MSLAPLTVSTFNSSMDKAEFKDKLGRLIQYGARLYAAQLASEGRDKEELFKQAKAVQGIFGDARRTFRLMKETAVLPALQKELAGDGETCSTQRLLAIANKGSLLLFLLADHMLWAQKLGIVKNFPFEGGKPADSLKLVMKFFTIAHAAMFVSQIIKLQEQMGLESVGDPKFSAEKKRQFALNALKSLLLVVQGLHNSGWYVVDEKLVGTAGVVSSALDVMNLWPKAK